MPGVVFILDHCGVPQVRKKISIPGVLTSRRSPKVPNASCKISGLVAYADPQNWNAEDLQPFVEHVIASFGWDRVIFGSDWPVCTLSASCQQWVEALLAITDGAGKVNQRKPFCDNAGRVYKLI